MKRLLKKISTIGMSREEWLALRRHSIGGSDAAAIVGLSKYSSPFSVWADKTGRLPDKPDNEAMRQGHDLEEYVAQRFSESTEKRVKRCNAMLYNPAYPHSHADVDRMIVGENAGLECKTTSTLDLKQFRGVEFPEKYYAQCVHYMAITGADRWYLAVLVFGREFHVYTLERDEAEIRALMDAETAFWEQYVETDTPPAPDGAQATTDAIATVYAEAYDSDALSLLGHETELEEYASLKSQKKQIDLRLSEIENAIKVEMQECERAVCGAYRITWKQQEGRRSFSVQSLSHDYPDIDISRYYETGKPYRTFKITENKEDN